MRLITRDTDYAIRAILYIVNSKNKIVSASEIVTKLNMPRPFLRKILQTLQKRGILESIKGNRGGFQLALHPNKIFLVDLIKIFQGDIKIIECFFKKEICPNFRKCSLREKMKNIERIVFSKLKGINITSLLK